MQKTTHLKRIAIINRGEPAFRFIRALREYNFERDLDIKAIAFLTDADQDSPIGRLADEVVQLGPAFRTNAEGNSISAYCDHPFILAHLQENHCDGVWPGWGFISEDADFVELLEQNDITFIGPSSQAMRLLGDKVSSKQIAQTCGVPMAPWHLLGEEHADIEKVKQIASDIGYPLMVKASAGGGGRGIRKVSSPEALSTAIASASEEARKAFGSGILFMESCIIDARHIEVQFVVGNDGVAKTFGVRDCSIQRRNQKVLEEAPSPILRADTEHLLCHVTRELAEKVSYRGVGTAEFLYKPELDEAFFLEVNSRLQVEHTVTELLTGCDFVKIQLDIANGLDWQEQAGPHQNQNGHAVEVRLNAEHPEKGFQPSPGLVKVFRAPFGPGIRVDNGVMENIAIAPEFDSMIAKVIAWAPTRKQAVARLSRALQELQVVIEGGATNKAFLLQLLQQEAFLDGSASTTWLDGAITDGTFSMQEQAFEALLLASILECRRIEQLEKKNFFAQVQNGIPQQLSAPHGKTIDLRLREQNHTFSVYTVGPNRYLAGPEGQLHLVRLEHLGKHNVLLHRIDSQHQALYSYGALGITIEVDGHLHTIERASGGWVKSPAPAMVVQLHVEEGTYVKAGTRLCTLEAMKMEMAVIAQENGYVRTILCHPNQQVHAGQTLIFLEGEQTQEKESSSVSYPSPPSRPLDQLFTKRRLHPERLDDFSEEQAQDVVQELCLALRSVLLGYDISPITRKRVEVFFGQPVDFSKVKHPKRWRPLLELLEVFVDVERLFDRNALPKQHEAAALSTQLSYYHFCRRYQEGEEGAQEGLRELLQKALSWHDLQSLEPSEALEDALWRFSVAHMHNDLRHRLCSLALRILMDLHANEPLFDSAPIEEIEPLSLSLKDADALTSLQELKTLEFPSSSGKASDDAPPSTLNRLKSAIQGIERLSNTKYPFVRDNARQATYVFFEQQQYILKEQQLGELVNKALQELTDTAQPSDYQAALRKKIVFSRHSLLSPLLTKTKTTDPEAKEAIGSLLARLYTKEQVEWLGSEQSDENWLGHLKLESSRTSKSSSAQVICATGSYASFPVLLKKVQSYFGELAQSATTSTEICEILLHEHLETSKVLETLDGTFKESRWTGTMPKRITVTWSLPKNQLRHRTYHADGELFVPTPLHGIHPEAVERIELDRLQAFQLVRLCTPENMYAFRGTAREHQKDERIFVFAEVHMPSEPEDFMATYKQHFEKVYYEGLKIIREAQAKRNARKRLEWNRFTIYIQPGIPVNAKKLSALAKPFETKTRGLGLQKVIIRTSIPKDSQLSEFVPTEFTLRTRGRHRLEIEQKAPSNEPIRPITEYAMKVIRSKRLGYTYPYEIIRMLEGREPHSIQTDSHIPKGTFQEYDLDENQLQLVPTQRAHGQNAAGVVVGTFTHFTETYPEGMTRVWLASDPTKAMGALAEPECRRVLAAFTLAEEKNLPIEWIPISAGARISMESGTENLDWTAKVLKKIVEFTQKGGEINLIIAGVNVGAQSYWNAEATMLMHTKGALIMTPNASMVLTGKKALEYAGSVSAEDERGIGGFDRIMGPNGQAQYAAKDLGHAYETLFHYYQFTYIHPEEPRPRPFPSKDAAERSILSSPYNATQGEVFKTIGDLFDPQQNPGRKKPFAIRQVMKAVIDQDSPKGPLERFMAMRHAETAVVWDAHIGGWPITLIGFESHPLPRRGRIPIDGPEQWTGGTLFPQSSKKVATALNAASGNRPAVILANLSGFDGSPESLRKLQLEMGAEIGRAVVNFQGPIVFVVIGRYHGGAYVVFSKSLNPNLTTLALEGTYASVIGGAPAAAVVFPHQVKKRTLQDPRIQELKTAQKEASSEEKPRLREEYDKLFEQVTLQKQGELAQEFDAIHTVERAVSVGSIDKIIPAEALRPEIIQILAKKNGSTS